MPTPRKTVNHKVATPAHGAATLVTKTAAIVAPPPPPVTNWPAPVASVSLSWTAGPATVAYYRLYSGTNQSLMTQVDTITSWLTTNGLQHATITGFRRDRIYYLKMSTVDNIGMESAPSTSMEVIVPRYLTIDNTGTCSWWQGANQRVTLQSTTNYLSWVAEAIVATNHEGVQHYQVALNKKTQAFRLLIQ